MDFEDDQWRKCGKPTCSVCNRGDAHGPYWYAFHWEMEGDKKHMKSRYVGKKAPEEVRRRQLSMVQMERLGRSQLTEESYGQVLAMIKEEYP